MKLGNTELSSEGARAILKELNGDVNEEFEIEKMKWLKSFLKDEDSSKEKK